MQRTDFGTRIMHQGALSSMQTNGSVKQFQHKQMQVFQSQTSSGLQMIHAQALTNTSTGNRWSSYSSEESSNGAVHGAVNGMRSSCSSFASVTNGRYVCQQQQAATVACVQQNGTKISQYRAASASFTTGHQREFDGLNLVLHPLDLSSQKSKVSVGRSGSIGGRRPPTRRITNGSLTNGHKDDARKSNDLDDVANFCQKIHDDMMESNAAYENELFISDDPKSNSIEDMPDIDNLDQLRDLKRTSKLRRSLQYSNEKGKPRVTSNRLDLDEINRNYVSKIRQDFEKGRVSTGVAQKDDDWELIQPKKIEKRHSLISTEAIMEAKNRLNKVGVEELHITDDSIRSPSKVKAFVVGFESMLGAKESKTGSLESKKSLTNRSNDWYNRRKSYGFEQVFSDEYNKKISQQKVESSTDSGICRSSEMVNRFDLKEKRHDLDKGRVERSTDGCEIVKKDYHPTTCTILENQTKAKEPTKSTTVNITNDLTSVWNKILKSNSFGTNDSLKITIPIRDDDGNFDERREGTPLKRHSIAVDESKYVAEPHPTTRRTSLVVNPSVKAKGKKVEFCKTEVHFTADSGRVNIIETDEKPPPTQNFRRRRRSSSVERDKERDSHKELKYIETLENGKVPVMRFGDERSALDKKGSLERKVIARKDVHLRESGQDFQFKAGTSDVQLRPGSSDVQFKTRSPDVQLRPRSVQDVQADDIQRNIDDELKGILKNPLIKPKPYHLGEEPSDTTTPWGVKLRPVASPVSPNPSKWKSTVTISEEPMPKVNSLPIRHSSWSEEKIRQFESRLSQSKGYSTKVNFDGDTITVEDRLSDKEKMLTWPKREETSCGSGVRIEVTSTDMAVIKYGRTDKPCDSNTNPNHHLKPRAITFNMIRLPRASLHNLTSTSLTKPSEASHSSYKPEPNATSSKISFTIQNGWKYPHEDRPKTTSHTMQQLEVLRKMYEQANEQSEDSADEEVQSYMTSDDAKNDDVSVLSGSWSKLHAAKQLNQFFLGPGTGLRKTVAGPTVGSKTEPIDCGVEDRTVTKSLNDPEVLRTVSMWKNSPKLEERSHVARSKEVPTGAKMSEDGTEVKKTNAAVIRERLRSKDLLLNTKTDTHPTPDYRSSASDSEQIRADLIRKCEMREQNRIQNSTHRKPIDKAIEKTAREGARRTTEPYAIRSRLAVQTYPDQIRSPRTARKYSEKTHAPGAKTITDSMERRNRRHRILSEHEETRVRPERKVDGQRRIDAPKKPVHCDSPIPRDHREPSPVYENRAGVNASILDELTKAADEILKAVNGYTDDESFKFATDSDEELRKRRQKLNVMNTISETAASKHQTRFVPRKLNDRVTRNAAVSSTSSVDSDDQYSVGTSRRAVVSRLHADTESSRRRNTAIAHTSRHSRMKSREMLTPGSSSEDLTAGTDCHALLARRPRLLRKVKNPERSGRGKDGKTVMYYNDNDESVAFLRAKEIQHKTAVSAMKNLAGTGQRSSASRKSDSRKTTLPKDDVSCKSRRSSSSSKRIERLTTVQRK